MSQKIRLARGTPGRDFTVPDGWVFHSTVTPADGMVLYVLVSEPETAMVTS